MYDEWNEFARQLAEELRGAHPSFSADGNFVVGSNGPSVLSIECRGRDHFTVGRAMPPTRGGWWVQGLAEPRVTLDRAEMMKRANEWAARN